MTLTERNAGPEATGTGVRFDLAGKRIGQKHTAGTRNPQLAAVARPFGLDLFAVYIGDHRAAGFFRSLENAKAAAAAISLELEAER